MTKNKFQAKWDKLTVDQRKKIILSEPSMRGPRWEGLVNAMSNSTYAELTPLQRDGIPTFFNYAGIAV